MAARWVGLFIRQRLRPALRSDPYRKSGWIRRAGGHRRGSECGLELVEAGSEDGAAEEVLEGALVVEGVDPLSYGVRHLAEPGVEDVQDRFAGILKDAFFEAFLEALLEAFLDTFLESLLEGEFFEEGDVGHDFVG